MAVYYVTPLTNLTEFIASDEVLPGDVLLLEDGVYRQTVLVEKNYLRFVANGKCVIFDGGNTMINGLFLRNVVGVEVLGLHLQNYIFSSIAITSGSSNRILRNHTVKGDIGIALAASNGNLIYENVIEDVDVDGIRLAVKSTGNFVLENKISGSGDDGIDCFFAEDANNLFVGNEAKDNSGSGFEILGENSCAFANHAVGNANFGLAIFSGANIVALQNEACDNELSGVRTASDNSFVGMNTLIRNKGAGVEVSRNFSIIEYNDIQFNQNNGLLISEDSGHNLALRNRFVGNMPVNILNNGDENNFVENVIEKLPCKAESMPYQGAAEKTLASKDYLAEKIQKAIKDQTAAIAKTEAVMDEAPEVQMFILEQMKEQLKRLTEYQERLSSAASS